MLNMDEDEDLARKLQEEFDREAEEVEIQSKRDALFAQKLASRSHKVSDSESEEDASDNPISGSLTEHNINLEPELECQGSGVKRPICKFGAECYRKNPIHLKEFYHPASLELSNEGASSEPSNKKFKEDCTTRKHVGYERKSFDERLKISQPYRFFLNKIYSIPETHKDWQTLVFPDLLNPELGTMLESAQLNFMIDLEFVMKFYRKCGLRKIPILFMYGQLEGNAKDYEGVTCVKVDVPFQYGVHHTKMMILHYKEGLRIVIHTANLIPDDWNEKTQGFWISPLFPPLDEGKMSLLDGESKTNFKRDFTDYLLSYKSPDLIRWTHIVKGHDFSSCNVHFIGSVPGYHTGETRFKFGHMKCRNLIRKWSKWKPNGKLPIIAQCSSIGSLGKDSQSWLSGEFGVSLMGGNETSTSSLNVIYPSEEDVRNSVQGYGGGSCLPYRSNTHMKQLWFLKHLHSWRSKARLRTSSMPHIKTYTRLSSNNMEAQFFLLTSSNLSKAAWGQLQKQGTQLFIRSYEAGVLLLPEHVIGADSFPLTAVNDKEPFGLPYDVPICPYSSGDVPWLMDTPKNKPDIHQNTYP